MKILKRPEVEEKTTLCRASIYRAIANNDFPSPVQLKGRAVGWYEHEIDEWLASRPRTLMAV